MKFTRGLAVIGGSLLAAPSAHAIALNTPTTLCLTIGAISSCASVTVTVASNVLTATITSLNTAPTNAPYAIKAFGFFAYGGTTDMLALSPVSGGPPHATQSYADIVGPVTGTWVFYNGANDLSGGEKPAGSTWLGGATKNGSSEIAAGGTGVWTFNITGTLPSDIYFAWHGISWDGPDNVTSFKCYEGGTSTPEGASCGPETVVPEPATMALLATGLVGLGGAGLIRRRRNG